MYSFLPYSEEDHNPTAPIANILAASALSKLDPNETSITLYKFDFEYASNQASSSELHDPFLRQLEMLTSFSNPAAFSTASKMETAFLRSSVRPLCTSPAH